MKFVLDASVAVKWVVPEEDSAKAIQLREDYHNQIHELIAPNLFFAEIAHALTKAERRGIIQQYESLAKMMDIAMNAPRLHEYGPLLADAMIISATSRCAINDCVYLQLALEQSCGYVTADQRFVNSLQGQFPCIVSLESL